MLTLEVYGHFVTWPEEFALWMMLCYRNRGVPFVVHNSCLHSGWNAGAAKRSSTGMPVQVGAFEYACEYH